MSTTTKSPSKKIEKTATLGKGVTTPISKLKTLPKTLPKKSPTLALAKKSPMGGRFSSLESKSVVTTMTAVDVNFKAGDNAVYPGHGVGRILAIETKEILGNKQTFYSVQIIETGMKIMIPKDNVASVGLRPIISKEEAGKVVSILKEKDVKIDTQTWNRRYREYMEKIKTGSVYEIAEVLRDLFLLKIDKELSFGERKMLDTARTLLLKELSLATSQEELFNESEVKAIFGVETV